MILMYKPWLLLVLNTTEHSFAEVALDSRVIKLIYYV